MRCLLDTHTFIWFVEDDHRLSGYARELFLDQTHAMLISVASLWEITIKASLGRIKAPHSFSELVEQQIVGNGMELLPIIPPHFDCLIELPLHHKDPFDRLIIAQAMADDLSIISRDKAFSSYDVPVLWDNHS